MNPERLCDLIFIAYLWQWISFVFTMAALHWIGRTPSTCNLIILYHSHLTHGWVSHSFSLLFFFILVFYDFYLLFFFSFFLILCWHFFLLLFFFFFCLCWLYADDAFTKLYSTSKNISSPEIEWKSSFIWKSLEKSNRIRKIER